MSYQIVDVNPELDERWDAFVKAHPKGAIYHHSLWGKVLTETFGYKSIGLIVQSKEKQEIAGILPLMLISNPFLGRRISSLPMTTYCPNLISDELFDDVIRYINKAHPDCKQLELKYLAPLKDSEVKLPCESNYVDHIVELDMAPDDFFHSVLPKDVRRKIRKADKHDILYRLGETLDDLGRFYNLLLSVRKKHKLPPLPFTFFKKMWKILAPQGMLFLQFLEYQGEMVAADLVLKYKNTYHVEYGASDSRFHHLGVNQKLFFEGVRSAHKNEIHFIDLGRTHRSQQSLIAFKERHGGKPHRLAYHYYPELPKRDVRNFGFLYKALNWSHYILPKRLMDLEAQMIYRFFG